VNLDGQIIFFLSALGAFNGMLLSIYFLITSKKNKFSNYYLAFLLLMLSIRVIKSVFFYFNPDLSGIFIQIGLSALILIGPFSYLYFKSINQKTEVKWMIHTLPFIIGITILGICFPYVEYWSIWSKWIVSGIYLQWLFYIVMSYKYLKPHLIKIGQKNTKISNLDFWLISIYVGVFFVWLAYTTVAYTSYIMGALSFSFILYLVSLLLIFKNNKNSTFFQENEKYRNKIIDQETIVQIERKITIIKDKELFLNPNLTLADVANELNVSKHNLSQYLNEKVSKSFTTYVNDFRIERAKQLLQTGSNYTIDALGYDSGFNSKSTFYTAFKKTTGKTPNEFRKSKGF